MTLAELAQALDLPPRQVRYLIAEAIIPPARTLGRGANAFDDSHLLAGRAFKALAAQGHGVRKAKALLEARAQLSAMVVDLDPEAERQRLRFGPIEVLASPQALAALSDPQFAGVMTALTDRLAALRASGNPAPATAPARRRPASRKDPAP